jgi:hypothetical protein
LKGALDSTKGCGMNLFSEFLPAVGTEQIAVFAHARVSLAIAFEREFLIYFFATTWAKPDRRIAAAVVHVTASIFVTHEAL